MEFKDRVANKPNRVKLTYEDSGASTFATVELVDEPIEEGTPLNAENMNKLLNKEDYDYIVEQGTKGSWTYKKMNSGEAICYGKFNYYFTGERETFGAFYRERVMIDLPNGLFKFTPKFAVGNFNVPGSLNIDLYRSSKDDIYVWVDTAVAYGDGNSCELSILLVGTWK